MLLLQQKMLFPYSKMFRNGQCCCYASVTPSVTTATILVTSTPAHLSLICHHICKKICHLLHHLRNNIQMIFLKWVHTSSFSSVTASVFHLSSAFYTICHPSVTPSVTPSAEKTLQTFYHSSTKHSL